MLAAAAARVRVVGAITPVNLSAELARLAGAWMRTGAEAPRFVYAAAPDHGAMRGALEAAAKQIEPEGELGAMYAARAREIAMEAAICEAAGGCWEAARERYAPRDAFDREGDALAALWIEEGMGIEEEVPSPLLRSDDERARGSLLSRMREEVGARRLPVRVVVVDIAPLAATGDLAIQVAAGRLVSREDVERTVLHEVEGHAAPQVRAAAMPLGIFAIGTARGSDDQEGRALAIERAGGFLIGRRRRELALRHVAARSVERGADFVETVRLVQARGAVGVSEALRIAARVHRGGGLGREVVYLPALLRVEAALRGRPELDEVLGAGRIAASAASALRGWMPAGEARHPA
jgi:hypothetical protein